MFRVIIAALLVVAGLGAAYLVSLNDHRAYQEVATTTPQAELNQYSSEEGVSFSYPTNYGLSSHHEGNAERGWDVLVLLPKGYVPPKDGEGPPTISMSVFDNPEGTALDKWVTGDSRSNWKLAAQNGGLGSLTVGGEPALAYKYSGLYETDAVAVMHKGKVFLFQAGWMTPQDTIRSDFLNLLATVQFN